MYRSIQTLPPPPGKTKTKSTLQVTYLTFLLKSMIDSQVSFNWAFPLPSLQGITFSWFASYLYSITLFLLSPQISTEICCELIHNLFSPSILTLMKVLASFLALKTIIHGWFTNKPPSQSSSRKANLLYLVIT